VEDDFVRFYDSGKGWGEVSLVIAVFFSSTGKIFDLPIE